MNRFVRPFPEKENKKKETRYVHATKMRLTFNIELPPGHQGFSAKSIQISSGTLDVVSAERADFRAGSMDMGVQGRIDVEAGGDFDIATQSATLQADGDLDL